MRNDLNGNSHLRPSSVVEVFEIPNRQGILGFKVTLSPLMVVEGNLNAAAVYDGISSKAWLLLDSVLNGESLDGTPFSKAQIKANSKWKADNRDPRLYQLMDEVIREASKREIVLMLERLTLLPQNALTEGVILACLDMDEDEIFGIATGGRRKILKAHAKGVGRTVFAQMTIGRSVRGRVWTKARRLTLLESYDATLVRLENLKKICRKLRPDEKPRDKRTIKLWQQLKSENSDLADVLDLLRNTRPSELALSHVCKLMNTKACAQVHSQIKRARRERNSLLKQEGVTPIEVFVSRVVDSVVPKREVEVDPSKMPYAAGWTC